MSEASRRTVNLSSPSFSRDESLSVIFSTSAYHREGCKVLSRVHNPEIAPRWQSMYRMTPPCRICWRAQEMNWWLSSMRWFHQNCSPHIHLPESVKVAVGRPRGLTEHAFKRVLSLSNEGYGSRAVVTALRAEGVAVSRATVQRAIQGRGAYAASS